MLRTNLFLQGRTPFGTPFPKDAGPQRSSSNQYPQSPRFLSVPLLKIWSALADVKKAVFWKPRKNVCVDCPIANLLVEIHRLLCHTLSRLACQSLKPIIVPRSQWSATPFNVSYALVSAASLCSSGCTGTVAGSRCYGMSRTTTKTGLSCALIRIPRPLWRRLNRLCTVHGIELGDEL